MTIGTGATLFDAEMAIKGFMAAMLEAQGMAARGEVGADLDDLLLHAKDLLDILDEAMLELDVTKHRELFEAAPILRAKLEALRDELRGGRRPLAESADRDPKKPRSA